MTGGTLDRRPRSASSERPGSRASSVSSDEPQVVSRSPSGLSTRLDALMNENASPQVSTMTLNDDYYLEDEPSTSESSLLQNHTDEDAKAMPTNRKHRDGKTQEALVEMARLDFVLARSELKLNQVKLQRKEWSQKRWSEYMVCIKQIVVLNNVFVTRPLSQVLALINIPKVDITATTRAIICNLDTKRKGVRVTIGYH
ncbi:unnamed protein product [Boreogadus saida]